MPAPDYVTEIASLEAAIGSGVLRAEQDGEMVIYQSIDQMIKARDMFRQAAAANASAPSSLGKFGFSAPGYIRE